MIIKLEKKDTLSCDDFLFKCSIGKRGLSSRKVEGDKKTPKGTFSLGPLFYRKDRNKKPFTKIKTVNITKNMGWCDDVDHFKYNCLIKINKKIKHEKMYRTDRKYDFLIPIKYNFKKPISGRGSCIFIHLTKDHKPTAGCVALREKDFLIMLKLIRKNSKIKIV